MTQSSPSPLARETAAVIFARYFAYAADLEARGFTVDLVADLIQSALDRQRVEVVEECARVCDALEEKYEEEDRHKWPEETMGREYGAEYCAYAIRQLSHPTDNKQDERSGR